MKKLFYNQKQLNIFLNKISNLGELLKSYQEKNKYFEVLNTKNFKTQIDLKINIKLSLILKEFINIPVVSEEDKNFLFIPKSFWLIDPIDGTKSLINGFDGYVIQGCFILSKKPIFSFILAPKKKLLWHSIRNKGVFLNGVKVKQAKKFKSVLVDNYPKPKGLSKIVFQQLSMKNYIECGSFGLKSALVVSNIANLFVKNVQFYDWDIMPAILMLEELNYFARDLKGNKIKLSNDLKKTEGLIVTNCMKSLKEILKLKLYDK